MNGLLEREKQATMFQYHRVSELEKEIEIFKNRPLWKKLLEDIKPRYVCGYSRWYKWEEFLVKVFWVMMAVIFAVSVFIGNYFLLKYARIWNRMH